VFTTDLFVEGVHFRRRGLTAEEAGRRAMGRSLSDLAAMGARPGFCLVSLALARWADGEWVEGFFRGLIGMAERFRCALAGGDLSEGRIVVCDVMACGAVKRGRALRRDGAKAGDVIYVSGALGGWKRRAGIEPRVDLGRKLVGKATAAMDISDGLALDLYRLCAASGVEARLEREPPMLEGATIDEALYAGEDYELVYTAPAGVRVPGFAIGEIVKGKAGRVTLMGRPVKRHGYEHFESRGDSGSD
jgi:thiamine-monophosphate kinase